MGLCDQSETQVWGGLAGMIRPQLISVPHPMTWPEKRLHAEAVDGIDQRPCPFRVWAARTQHRGIRWGPVADSRRASTNGKSSELHGLASGASRLHPLA
jgi:hypothetical protein